MMSVCVCFMTELLRCHVQFSFWLRINVRDRTTSLISRLGE